MLEMNLFGKLCFCKNDIILIISLMVLRASLLLNIWGKYKRKEKANQKQRGENWPILKGIKVNFFRHLKKSGL